MKVLNVIWAFGTGGIGKLFLTYAALGEYDLELQISSVCIDLQNCEYDRKPLTEAGIRVIAIKNRKDMSWVKRLGGIAREVKPDVVFCHGFNGPVIIKLVACLERSLRVPMVCTYHGLYNPPTEGRRYIADAINKLQAWMYKRFARTVVLVAEYSGLYLLERKVPKSKLEVVYNGIVAEEISPYITAVLEQVSRTAVVAEETEQAEDIPQRQTEARRLTVASMRLDAVASEAFHLARGKTQTLIHAEKAQVNWNIVTSTSHLLKEGDLVSLRGFGRFRVKEIGGRTKKDRIGLEIEKYV
mgnify:CR=1 FL=1